MGSTVLCPYDRPHTRHRQHTLTFHRKSLVYRIRPVNPIRHDEEAMTR